MPMIYVEGIVREPPDWVAMTRRIAKIALRINDRLIAENDELKRELASREENKRA